MTIRDEELIKFLNESNIHRGWHINPQNPDKILSAPFDPEDRALFKKAYYEIEHLLGEDVLIQFVKVGNKAQLQISKNAVSLEIEKKKNRISKLQSDLSQSREGVEVKVPAILSRGGKAEGLLKREHYMLTLRQVNFVRKMQLEQAFNTQRSKEVRNQLETQSSDQLDVSRLNSKEISKTRGIVISNENYPNIFGPEDPAILIGQNGETIMLCEQAMLGQGGLGAVYIGQNLDTGDFCVVKRLYMVDDDSREDFAIENENLNDLNQLIDTQAVFHRGVENLYSTIDLAWGKNYCKELGIEEGMQLNYDFLSRVDMYIKAIEKIHDLHVKDKKIHRDIKAENVMWDNQNKVAKVVDFGFTRDMDPDGKFITERLAGTPSYVAPELFDTGLKGEPCTYSTSTDSYALGMLGCEMFSGDNLAFSVDDAIAAFKQNTNTEGPLSIFNDLDIFTPANHTNTEQDFYNEIKKLMDVNPENRPSLEVVLANLKRIQLTLHHERGIELSQVQAKITPPVTDSGIQKNSMEKYMKEEKIKQTMDQAVNKQLHAQLEQLRTSTLDLQAKLLESLSKTRKVDLIRKNELNRDLKSIEKLITLIDNTHRKPNINAKDLINLANGMVDLNVEHMKQNIFQKLFYKKDSPKQDLINNATKITSQLLKLTLEYEMGITMKENAPKMKSAITSHS